MHLWRLNSWRNFHLESLGVPEDIFSTWGAGAWRASESQVNFVPPPGTFGRLLKLDVKFLPLGLCQSLKLQFSAVFRPQTAEVMVLRPKNWKIILGAPPKNWIIWSFLILDVNWRKKVLRPKNWKIFLQFLWLKPRNPSLVLLYFGKLSKM